MSLQPSDCRLVSRGYGPTLAALHSLLHSLLVLAPSDERVVLFLHLHAGAQGANRVSEALLVHSPQLIVLSLGFGPR